MEVLIYSISSFFALFSFYNVQKEAGEHEDLYFHCPLFNDGYSTINSIEYRNNTLYLKHTYKCDYVIKTCIGLSKEIESLELSDDVEVLFVIEDIPDKKQIYNYILTPFEKKDNDVIIEVYFT